MRSKSAAIVSITFAVLAATPSSAQRTAESLLQRLSLREKAGQLFMSWSLSRANPTERAELFARIEEAGLGGVILSLGSARQAVDLIHQAQRRASIPLLCAGDFEAGVGFRLTGTSDFGNNMLIAATGSTALAQRVGEATGVEARALGFHWCFAPVVDVNSNPANPIINVRSFGEQPDRVSKFAAAFTRGVESAGVLATAKHFPGHGDVASDSHLTMPTVPGKRARLERVELPPFRAAIDAGISSIMTGHLSVPGLGENPSVPATLSHTILTKLLREQWKFRGLIVTDALDMGGVREKISPAEAAVRALNAGADVLLMPPDPVAARDAIVAAVDAGIVRPETLDRAVLRILRAKQRSGLLSGERAKPSKDWRRSVTTKQHIALADEVAERGLTLVRDEAGLLPLDSRERRGAIVIVRDKPDTRGAQLTQSLAPLGFVPFALDPESSTAQVEAATRAIRTSEDVIVTFAIKVRSYSGKIGVPPKLAPIVTALRDRERAIAISLGNPYLVRDFPRVSTYLCAFAATPHTERALGRALRGEASINGRMPVGIPGISSAGDGLTLHASAQLQQAKPSEVGLSDDLSARIRGVCDRAIANRAFPGAVVCVTRRGKVAALVAAGRHTYELDAPIVTPNTRFDLASLTKVCATTPTALRLAAAGKLDLDKPVSELVPSFQGGDKQRVTVRHLLTHSSGLPAYVRFFRTMKGKAKIVEAAATTKLRRAPGTGYEYSDLGLILLMACIEKVTGEPFEQTAQREVFDPLGMQSATFVRSGSPIEAPPTEQDEFRGRLVTGEVHDENAFAMGGVSGHAGLFANATDVATLGNAFLGGGTGWLPANVARSAVRRAGMIRDSSRALGWDTFVSGGSGGTMLSEQSFGHTGFTGTSIWCDPRTDLCIVLLTNRVYPTRANKKVFAVRRELADLVAGSLTDR